MTETVLYCEGSLCLATGAAGWGAVVEWDGGDAAYGGELFGAFGNAVTLMELAAIQRAFEATEMRGFLGLLGGHRLVIASRSTAALAVLRWVFVDAPYQGAVEVHPPKRLKKPTREFQPLYALSEDVERLGVPITLRLVPDNDQSASALNYARRGMEVARRHTRRSA